MSATKIEWTDLTINPVVGCSKCSSGCDNCYAERFAARLAKNPKTAAKYAGVVDDAGRWTGQLSIEKYMTDRIYGPFKNVPFTRASKCKKMIYLGSMTDMFHENMPSDVLDNIISMCVQTPQHTFLLLTKRPENMLRYFEQFDGHVWPHIWLGVTVCNQAEAEAKIPILLSIPAAKRFISVEPMLGPVTLYPYDDFSDNGHGASFLSPSINAAKWPGLDWVICGGETGPGARPMHPDWVRGLRDQCQQAGAPFFFKGWGEYLPVCPDQVPDNWKDCAGFHVVCAYGYHEPLHGLWHCRPPKPCAEIIQQPTGKCPLVHMRMVGKKRAGRLLDGREWNEVPL